MFPASDDLGTTIALSRGPGGYAAWTKRGDAYGINVIEKLTARSLAGPWVLNPVMIPVPEPAGMLTYSVEAHAEPGGLLLSWAVSGPGRYWLSFGAGLR